MAKRTTKPLVSLKTGKKRVHADVPIMSPSELLQLGGGIVVYMKVLTAKDAKEQFPTVEDLPSDGELFAVYGADGTPLALTDTRSAAIGYAKGDDLKIASLH